jgi:hypothetical protein
MQENLIYVGLFSVQSNLLENQSIEETDKKRDSYHYTNKSDNKSKLIYFEHNYKEEQESCTFYRNKNILICFSI